jgi:hypothetical protein
MRLIGRYSGNGLHDQGKTEQRIVYVPLKSKNTVALQA